MSIFVPGILALIAALPFWETFRKRASAQALPRRRRECRVVHHTKIGCRCPSRRDDRYLAASQIGGQLRQSINPIFCPAIFDCNISTFGIAGLVQTLPERGQTANIIEMPSSTAEESDNRRRRLLRPRRARPDRRTTDQCDELAPPHGAYPKGHGSRSNYSMSGRASQQKRPALVRYGSIASDQRGQGFPGCPLCLQ
jgi:hypothetical protein